MPVRLVTWMGSGIVLAGLALAGVTDRAPRHDPPHQAIWREAGDVSVRAVEAGTGPPTIVLLHGFGEHLLTWRGILDPLAVDARVVALDLPGFGGSDKPAGPWSVEAMTDRVIAFLAAWTEPPVTLVGHSMGGQIAATVALQRPDLVSRLVLLAPSGYRAGLAGLADGMTETRATAIGIWEAARAFITPMHDPGWLAEPADRAAYDPSFDPAFSRAVQNLLVEFDFTALGERYGELRTPTLLVWGRRDPVIPAWVGDTLAARIPCARLHVLENTLHRPHVERPDTVVTLLRQFIYTNTC